MMTPGSYQILWVIIQEVLLVEEALQISWNSLAHLLTFLWERNLEVQICPWEVYLHLQGMKEKKEKED